MADGKLNDFVTSTLEGVREIADSKTIIGDPINTNAGTVIIPVSKISIGFASGGTDFMPKTKGGDKTPAAPARDAGKACFGGGGGTGMSVTPVCFLVVKENGTVDLLPVTNQAINSPAANVVDSVSSFIEKSPDLITRFKEVFKRSDKKKDVEVKVEEKHGDETITVEEK